MGCLNTKKAKPVESNGGSKVKDDANQKQEEEGPDANLVDLTGLSTRQKFSLRQSWKGIKRQMEDTGVEMFVRLFKTNADLQGLFREFKDIRNDDELRSNEALENHATLVMTTLDDAITHIDNYDFIRQLLTKTGGTHIRIKGFEISFFLHMKEPFLEAVRVTLGDRYTENMQNIYTIAITFILNTLVEGIQDALDRSESNAAAARQ